MSNSCADQFSKLASILFRSSASILIVHADGKRHQVEVFIKLQLLDGSRQFIGRPASFGYDFGGSTFIFP